MFVEKKSHTGITAMGIFLFFWSNHGLTRRSHVDLAGAILDRRWALNAPAYRQLAPFGKTVGIPLLLLGGTMAVAGTAWFKRRLWGWRLVVAIIATQVLGDLVNAFRGDLFRGGVGFVIAGLPLVYLLRPNVRAAFASGDAPRLG